MATTLELIASDLRDMGEDDLATNVTFVIRDHRIRAMELRARIVALSEMLDDGARR